MNTVSKWETGLAIPSPANSRMLEQVLGVPICPGYMELIGDGSLQASERAGMLSRLLRSLQEELEARDRRPRRLLEVLKKTRGSE